MKRNRLWVVVCWVVGCVAVYMAARSAEPLVQRVRAQSASFVPYTMEFQTVFVGQDGVVKLGEKRRVSVRSDGAEAWVGVWPGEASKQLKKVVWSDGRTTTMIESIGAQMSAPGSSQAVASRATRAIDGGPDCRFHGESAMGKETILGVAVSVSSKTVVDRRVTVWRSPGYGCATLKARHERLIDGRWQLRTESVPLSFEPGEPAALSFQQSLLDEVPPSEIVRRLAQRDGVDLSNCSTCTDAATMQELDSRYYGATRPK